MIGAFLVGRNPNIANHSVCIECKQRGNPCVLVAHGTPCLGPATHAGCGALCPTYHRGCYGCFGPSETPNVDALAASLGQAGLDGPSIERLFHTFNAWSQPFRGITTPVAAPTRKPGDST